MAGTTVCDGCGKELDPFQNHLFAVLKVQRNVSQTFPVEDADLDADDDDEIFETVVGVKSGVAASGVFHDVSCLAKFLKSDTITEKGVADLKLRKNREDDSYLYAAALAEGDEG